MILVTFAAPTGDRHSLGSAITHSIALMLRYPAPTLHHALTHPRAKHVFKASTIAAPIS